MCGVGRFRTPLLYTCVTGDIVRERSLQLEVCMTQKQSRRAFLMAMVHMPLRTAVRRPIREKYPLIPCMNITIPNNMRVYSAAELQLESSKGGHSRVNGRVASPAGGGEVPLTARDVELEDAVSLSGEDFLRSHLSLCLDADDSDEDNGGGLGGSDDGRLREVRIGNGVGSGGSSTTTLNIPSSGDEGEENELDDDVPHVVTDGGRMSSARSTPVDMRSVGSGSGSSSKKKIIPNELLRNNISQDVTVDMPAEETVVEMGEIPPPLLSEGRQEAAVASASSVSPGAKPARRKIIPEEVNTPNALSEAGADVHSRKHMGSVGEGAPGSGIQGNSVSLGDGSERSGHNLPGRSPRKKKITVLPGGISIPSDSLPHPATHSSTDSEGLSPHSVVGPELSPLRDSAFTPASRPETPCWDFYDFNEDLQPEEDTEATSQTLEESLEQLRQQGIGSLQNLSMEPILPMVLVDDFDSLAVDGEQEEHSE